MPKIRDLGIHYIPETRQSPENRPGGVFAAGKKGCGKKSLCTKSNCPTMATGGKPTKKKALTREAIAQLQAQLQEKLAEPAASHADLTR